MRFQTEQYYHIFNRGVEKRDIFIDKSDYERFLLALQLYNFEQSIGNMRDFLQYGISHLPHTSDVGVPLHRMYGETLTDIIAYNLLPNHYHLILKQNIENGISKFMQRVNISYTKYFNKKYDRSGVLFQGKTKAKHIDSDEYLLWLSAYVNCNIEIHKIKKSQNYPWSSYDCYLGNDNNNFSINKNIVLNNFKNIDEYKLFCKNAIPSFQKNKNIKKYLIE